LGAILSLISRLAVGAALPPYRARAERPSVASENLIHDDAFARRLGYKGGLVPGVQVYAWMTRPAVEALGLEWVERGSFSVRFARPFYYDEEATVSARVADRTDDALTIEASALNPAGEVCATAIFALGSAATAPDPAAYPAASCPAERPQVSREHLSGVTVLGTPELLLDEATAGSFLDRYGESLPLYSGGGAPAHPAIYLDQANRALDRNVRLSLWAHVESHGQHLSPARVGERLSTRGKIARLWERKGHEFVEVDLLLVAEGSRPVASIRHVAIYKLRRP
jgi:acyl dehydratase